MRKQYKGDDSYVLGTQLLRKVGSEGIDLREEIVLYWYKWKPPF